MARPTFIAMLMLAVSSSAALAQDATKTQGAGASSSATHTSTATSAQVAKNIDVPGTASVQAAKTAAAQDTATEQSPAAPSDAGAKRQASSADGKEKTDVAAPGSDVKTLSGISILGNQEAPKSLVIVPWKSSEIGDMPGLSRLLDDAVQPIDKEVFMRELDYYEIRSKSR